MKVFVEKLLRRLSTIIFVPTLIGLVFLCFSYLSDRFDPAQAIALTALSVVPIWMVTIFITIVLSIAIATVTGLVTENGREPRGLNKLFRGLMRSHLEEEVRREMIKEGYDR